LVKFANNRQGRQGPAEHLQPNLQDGRPTIRASTFITPKEFHPKAQVNLSEAKGNPESEDKKTQTLKGFYNCVAIVVKPFQSFCIV